jgi:hypothetical protein
MCGPRRSDILTISREEDFMSSNPKRDPKAVAVVTVVTDPVHDLQSRQLVSSIAGCRRLDGSPTADGTPHGSRSVFELTHNDLSSGGLDARIEKLIAHGIGVHRVEGDHPAVRRTNRRLGYH